jgi:hypothetical protein
LASSLASDLAQLVETMNLRSEARQNKNASGVKCYKTFFSASDTKAILISVCPWKNTRLD